VRLQLTQVLADGLCLAPQHVSVNPPSHGTDKTSEACIGEVCAYSAGLFVLVQSVCFAVRLQPCCHSPVRER